MLAIALLQIVHISNMFIARLRTQFTKSNSCSFQTHTRKHSTNSENPALAKTFPNWEQSSIPRNSKQGTNQHPKENLVSINGINVHFRVEGEGSHPVLLLPGLVGTIETDFGHLFKHMNKSKFQLVSLDPPGYGKSRPYLRDHHGDYYARDAEVAVKLMDKLGYDKFSVLGWSNGGMTGNTMAALFPERVKKLVTIASVAYFDDDSVKRGLAVTNTEVWARPVLKHFHKVYEPEYLQQLLENYDKSTRELYTSGNYKLVVDRQKKVQCPTLVFHGDSDPVVLMTHALFFAERIKNCTAHIAPGGKHNVHMTHIKEFLNLVEPFLSDSV